MISVLPTTRLSADEARTQLLKAIEDARETHHETERLHEQLKQDRESITILNGTDIVVVSYSSVESALAFSTAFSCDFQISHIWGAAVLIVWLLRKLR